MSFSIQKLVRENVRRLAPYSSARSEFCDNAKIFLDANENSFGSPLGDCHNRYPDPHHFALKKRIAELNGVRLTEVCVGNGSDEAIDLLIRVFCRPQIDNVVICPPTYGMYEVAAGVNDVSVRRANLTRDFVLDLAAVRSAISENTKLIFLCSPNNPTGNLMERDAVLEIARSFDGILVVDEAYVHFSGESSLISELDTFPNLVVLQTFSKAWGLAGLRVGLAFAGKEIVELLEKIKPPYNVSGIAQEMILKALDKRSQVDGVVGEIVGERKVLENRLRRFPFVRKTYPSDANFLLVKMANTGDVYRFLLSEGIVVRDRSNADLCEGCLRITIGTPDENRALLDAFEKYEKSFVH